MQKKCCAYVFICFVMLLAACSSGGEDAAVPEEQGETEGQEEKENTDGDEEFSPSELDYYDIGETARPLTEFEQELLRKPGPYSGDDYDQEAVNAAIDELPDDLTAEEYAHELIYLVGEDYHEEVKTFANFDSQVDVDIQRPDGTVEEREPLTAHYAILMDASGSMYNYNGDKTRWDSAKEAVTEFAQEVPEQATISLRVYGHKGTGSDADKEVSCSTTENIYNDTYQAEGFQSALSELQPSGWTPIARALEESREDIPDAADEVVVYVVSDGIETCDGNPVEAAETLVDEYGDAMVNIIGFDVDDEEGQKLLQDVADAGNGEFVYVDSEQKLKEYMREQYDEIKKAWREWKEQGKTEAYAQKEEKKELAYDMKERVKEKSRREKERLKDAQDYLEDRFEDFGHPANDTFSIVVDHANEIWSYGVDTGNELWQESVNSGNEKWQEYVDEGNEQIRDAIDQKNNQE
ncbi:Ca-activated chloride channel family protein [Alteribacillus persepolensis]|uniref:Ca-activated chloride channel family protein n=1 Tax=Alteribacillus persepolensis TaxID=568899 RepID=A0A1G7Y6Q7_9BACI|nr:VWA domain-containing protein [Alteribacillus persepolensis]SDG92079.1 Ca-activated chloride channel family protein [Alteribacillus persepolensis]